VDLGIRLLLKRSSVKLSIVNVVATAELSQSIDLWKLAPVDGFLYDRAIYHCAYLKDEKTRAKVSIFGTGKMISIGARSLADSVHDLKYAAKRLANLHLIKPAEINVKLRNIVATTQLGRNLDLESLARTLPNVIYEPDQFPAAIYHAKELEGASVLVFSNGKIVFAGLRTRQQLETARKIIVSLTGLIDRSK
jgi:TATA-box binding protein (TBP) (component of TFIID and TFIIIB)